MSGAVAQPRVAGRVRERALLTAALHGAVAGRGGVVLLVGEAGLGKTTLAAELVGSARAAGVRVVQGHGWEGQGAPPLVVWRDVLDALGRAAGPVDPPAVLTGLTSAAEQGPLLVVVEDLHAADADSAAVVTFLSGRLTLHRVLLLVTYRPDDLARRPGAAQALAAVSSGTRTIPVPPLEPEEACALARDELGAGATAERVADVARRSEGNAFFLRELAQARPDAVPAGVAAAVRARLAVLAPSVVELLELCACAGRTVDVPLVAAAAGLEPARLLEQLHPAVTVGAVEDDGEGALRFRHALVAEALVTGLLPARRAQLSRRLADLLLARPGVPAPVVLHHLARAGALSSSAELLAWTVRAGDEAGAAGAPLEAVRHWRRALTQLAGCGSPGEAAALHERIGHALFSSGTDGVDAVAAFEQALISYDRAGERHRAAVVHSRLGAHLALYRTTSDLTRAQRHFAAAAEVLTDRVDRARLLVGTSTVWLLRGQVRRGLAEAAEAERISRAAGRSALAATGRLMRGAHLVHLGRVAEALDALEASFSTADRSRPLVDVQAAWHGIAAGVQLEDRPLAEAYAARARLALRGHHLPGQEQVVSDNLAPALAMTGDTALARHALAAEDLLGFALQREGLVPLYAGDWEAATRRLAQLVEADVAAGQLLRATLGCWALGWLARLQGRLDDARRWLCHLLDDAEQQDRVLDVLRLRGELVLVELAAGDPDAARAQLERCRARRPQGEDLRGLGVRLALAEAAVARDGFAAVLSDADRRGLCWLALDVLDRWAAAAPSQAPALRVELRRRVRALGAEGTGWASLQPAQPEPGEVLLRRQAGGWLLVTATGSHHLADSRGLGHLARLVREPGREWHVLDLVGGQGIPDQRPADDPLIDAAARAAYRRRLAELADDLAEAERDGDPDRAARARQEREVLAEHLAAATGLGGRDRGHAHAAERARQSVTKTLRAAVDRVDAVDRLLAGHLRTALRTGTFCSYAPDPASPLRWRVEDGGGRAR